MTTPDFESENTLSPSGTAKPGIPSAGSELKRGGEAERIGPTSFQILVVLGGICLAFFVVVGGIGGTAYYFVNQYREQQAEIARKDKVRADRLWAEAAERNRIESERLAREYEKQAKAEAVRQQAMKENVAAQLQQKAEVKPPVIVFSATDILASLEKVSSSLPAAQHRGIVQRLPNGADFILSSVPVSDSGLLSWRVHLLPSLGMKKLYSKFHLNEPWNSPHNMTLLTEIPKVFANPFAPAGHTCIVANVVLDGPVDGRTKAGDITDGLSETVGLVYLKPDAAVPWTQPDIDHPLQSINLTALSDLDELRFVALCSGNVTTIPSSNTEKLSALLSRSGGEHFDFDARGLPDRLLLPTPEDEPVPKGVDTDQQLSSISRALKGLMEDPARRIGDGTSSMLSWRVYLLPYLGHHDLYRKFRLQEPWNSQHNIALIPEIPPEYTTESSRGRCRYHLLPSPGAKWDVTGFPGREALQDDLNTTLAVYHAAPHLAATWTQPEPDFTVNQASDPSAEFLWQSLGWSKSTVISAATWGGSVVHLSPDMNAGKLRAMLSVSGNEPFDLTEAMKSPAASLRLIAKVAPPTAIEGKLELPPLPPGSTESLDAGQLIAPVPPLRTLGIAIHRYFERNAATPTSVKRTDGTPSGLSWRVHLLKELGQEPLYDRFHLDEPWDSEHNRQLLSFMPEVYSSYPGQSETTCYLVPGGVHGLLGMQMGLFNCDDGPGQTMLLARVPHSKEVYWTQPDPSPELSSLVMADYCDDSGVLPFITGTLDQLFLSKHVPDEIFRGIVSHGGYELIDARTTGRWAAQSLGLTPIPPSLGSRWEGDRMKQIISAVHSYHDTFAVLPPGQRNNGSGIEAPPLRATQLSWRVHILPFLGYQSLYSQFRLEEPWDSPHNTQLLTMMPDCFRRFGDSAATYSTRYVTFTGPGTPWPDLGESTKMGVADGMSNTIAFLEGETPVPWTKPEDYAVNMKAADWSKSLTPLLKRSPRPVALLDGAIRHLNPEISAETLKALITIDQAEIFRPRDAFLE